MTVLILHGIMGKAGENWGQWLHDECIKLGCNVLMPNLPNSDHPDRKEWFKVISELLEDVKDDIVLVGHSLAVTSLLDYCESSDKKIRALVSVSGFYEPYGMELNEYFLKEKNADLNKVKKIVRSFYAIYGDDDPYVPQEVLKKTANDLGVEPVVVKNGGHINKSAGFTELPQVLDFISKLN
ncbi:hypothetical protein A3G67_02655 [Candidatus Roizmanbacteria bacterium RIFCSPLOWO2_12_FULL_40_12]|uniref:Alpha/beta hydrolase n=1 Tax=Candidatus Roizmanbacteria bacterium RIFCSPLOWO2_01_FULL_40_42 TaxID=1802066 RepID=A0A1F7J632_9BACT|nr:MAG: hypothetical protein A2779_03945 [Candidatus Roizmanbacteria bacterium RIFCSPHIGHO2_01_FULL_40_98]OGK28652.1 MAG: hypothetical protein A3C31_01505 [Candidatus Roizmanbacteria bacterium RIFCSPHIGHO2_02_FULL_40_53]OGK29434.1 MAG: hypothetical protein A2W49_04275 [Candidatus Roizmanbacteria bacterium RIFCSPHIGHO2_12_41_18]OGK36636.1 MAG: hypothetical protein A3E69_00175 [Candidatus Roizmanbacteria bacterium RIFCSPHIGHO2_12_FULL_40_130]OGK51075.1 MAG: hypothetical protein A3B50_02830 [Candi